LFYFVQSMFSRNLNTYVTNRQILDNLRQRSRSDSLPRQRRFIPRRNAIYLLIISNPSKADVRLVSCSPSFLFDRRMSDALVWFSENAWFRGSDRLSAIVYCHRLSSLEKKTLAVKRKKINQKYLEASISQLVNNMKYAKIVKMTEK